MIKDSTKLIDATKADFMLQKSKGEFQFLKESMDREEFEKWLHGSGYIDGYFEGYHDALNEVIKSEHAILRHGDMEQKRVYLSGSITGLRRDEYMNKFFDAEKKFREKGYSVINPAFVCDELPEMTHGDYMQFALLMLSKAECIYVIDGENISKGVGIELYYAKQNGIERIYEP